MISFRFLSSLVLVLVQSQLITCADYRALTLFELNDNYHYPVCVRKHFMRILGYGRLDYYLENLPLSEKFSVTNFCPISKPVLGNRDDVASCITKTYKNENKCENPVRPIIQDRPNLNAPQLKCGQADNDRIMYIFGYRLCKWVAQEEFNSEGDLEPAGMPELHEIILPTYHICYDHKAKTTFYVKYKIISAHLLKEEVLRTESQFDPKTPLSSETFGYQFETDFETKAKIFKNNSDITPVKLVPPEDFAIAEWGTAVFHEINVKPMYKSFVETWNSIRDHIRIRAKEALGDIIQYVGTSLEPIPRYWWLAITAKISEKVKGIFIILHNVLSMDNPDPLCRRELHEDVCTLLNWKLGIPATFIQFITCCEPTNVMFEAPIPAQLQLLKGDEWADIPNGVLSKKNCKKEGFLAYIPPSMKRSLIVTLDKLPKRGD